MRHLIALSALSLATTAAAQSDAPSPATRAKQAAARATAMAPDAQDQDFASRGSLGTRTDAVIRDAAGKPVFNLGAYDFAAAAQAPDTVNPGLWRHAKLLAKHGLFRVTDRIWQVRGFDLANLTVVKGDTGWIVIDTLSSAETAAAAMALVREKLGDRPVAAIVITHSHSDHFGGIDGVVPAAERASRTVPVLAPAGFFEEAVSENVLAGPAMTRRATYQFGTALGAGATRSMGSGIGPSLAGGTRALPRPTREIAQDGEAITIDGVRMAFQLTPGTEAPAEMNIAFPDWKVVDMAENANVTQHNILTPRGARVRDTRAWVDGLTAAIERNPEAEVMIASHGWPRFGHAAVRDYLSKHRDAYAYLHDQTVRLMNQGLTGEAIAARLTLPDALAREWYNRPYYGSLPFNARAVYQFYLGWYDGNPAHLAPFAPADRGRRYVAALGGAAAATAQAQRAFDGGDYAWAAELLNHVVMADGADLRARGLLARAYDQLAWQSENSLWRNMYLSAAADLRGGTTAPPPADPRAAAQMAATLTLDQIASLLAVRLDPARAAGQAVKLHLLATDTGEAATLAVENGVLVRGHVADDGFTKVAAPRLALLAMLLGPAGMVPAPPAVTQLRAMLDEPTPGFPLVLPAK